jgi:tetrahydromethanopterin S-methyltransferase subunit B
MALTINEVAEKLKQLDEITLVELLDVNSNDIVNAFMDVVEEKIDKLEGELDDN